MRNIKLGRSLYYQLSANSHRGRQGKYYEHLLNCYYLVSWYHSDKILLNDYRVDKAEESSILFYNIFIQIYKVNKNLDCRRAYNSFLFYVLPLSALSICCNVTLKIRFSNVTLICNYFSQI